MTFPYKDEEFIRMWVADMEFATPDVVIDGMRERLLQALIEQGLAYNTDLQSAQWRVN